MALRNLFLWFYIKHWCSVLVPKLCSFCRKDSVDTKMSRKHSDETKRERFASHLHENIIHSLCEDCWILEQREMDAFLFYCSQTGLVKKITHKLFLLSGKIHQTLNPPLPKSPPWKPKKTNTGVQEPGNKFENTT